MYSSLCFAQDCKDLREGTFLYVNDSSETIEIKRKGNLHEEKNLKTNVVDKFRIKWKGDCEYELKALSSTDKQRRKKRSGPVQIKITNVNRNKHECICKCKFGDPKAKSAVLIKIE